MIENLMTLDVGGVTVGEILTVEFLAAILGNLVAAIAILVAGFILAGWAKRRIRRVGEMSPRFDATLMNFTSNIVRYAIIAFAILFVLNTFGIQTTSLIAVIGAAGLAIGLALQGTLSNIAAGVMIVFFRPVKIGDFVEVGGQMGTVKDINLNFIELATLDNVQVIMPNGEVWGNTIKNYSVHTERRAEWVFGVSYSSDLAKAEKVIIDTIMADPRAMTEPEPFIQVTNLGDYSVDFTVRVWCAAADLWGFSTDMKRAVKEALDAAGIEIPFPTAIEIQRPAA